MKGGKGAEASGRRLRHLGSGAAPAALVRPEALRGARAEAVTILWSRFRPHGSGRVTLAGWLNPDPWTRARAGCPGSPAPGSPSRAGHFAFESSAAPVASCGL